MQSFKIRGAKLALLLVASLLGSQTAAMARILVEEVYLARIEPNADRAIIARANGQTYVVEKGAGCASLWRYEGGGVLIISPGRFLNFGARLSIPDARQQCSVWKASGIGGVGWPWLDATEFGD